MASERYGRLGLAAIAAGALLLGACTTTEVTAVGPRRAALPPDCPVQVFKGPPAYDYKPVATVRVSQCEVAKGEEGCLSELRMAACSYGADTVFGVTEELSSIRMKRASFSGEASESTTTVTYRATLAVRL